MTGWRSRRAVAALVALGALLAVIGAGLAQLRVDTTMASFLPADDPASRGLDEAARSFGGDPIVVLAESQEPRALLGPDQLPKLVGLEGELAKLPDVAVVYGPGTVLNQIAGAAQNLLATVSGRRDSLRSSTEEQARKEGLGESAVQARVTGAVRDFDERYASLLVRGLPAGLPTLHNPRFAETVVFGGGPDAAPRPQWHFVVPAPDAVAILVRPRQDLDQAGTERLVDETRAAVQRAELDTRSVTVSGTPVVAAELSSTAQREIPLIGALALGLIVTCYLLVPWVRRRRHRLVPPAVTLLATGVVLGTMGWLDRPVSLGAIAFLPILIGIGSDFPAYVVRGANRRRVVAAALASACGFASLGLSSMPFVRDLGLALAAGIVAALGLILVLRRWLVSESSTGDGEPTSGGNSPQDDAMAAEPSERPEPTEPGRATPLRARSRFGLLAVVVIVAALGWAALPQLGTAARPDQLAAGLPALDDAAHAERVIGSSGEVQVLLSGPDVVTPEALDWMRSAQEGIVLEHGSDLQPIVSVPDLLRFLGPDPTPAEVSSAMALLPDHLRGSVVRPDRAQAVISLGIRLQDVSRQGALLDEVRAQLPPPPEGMTADVVGLPVAAARGVELLSEGRYLPDMAGIAGAGLILVIGLRRRSDAARAVLAAALTTGWSLALVWLLGITLSPLTIALGSLATATACEFTVLAGERRGRRAVAVAASAAALGYLALAVSDIAMLREFGLLLAATVLLSLAAAHTVLWLLPPREGRLVGEGDGGDLDGGRREVPSRSSAPGSMEVRT